MDSNRVTPEHTKARTNTRTPYHHVTFLNLYIDATVADAYSNNASEMEVKDVIVAKQKTQYSSVRRHKQSPHGVLHPMPATSYNYPSRHIILNRAYIRYGFEHFKSVSALRYVTNNCQMLCKVWVKHLP